MLVGEDEARSVRRRTKKVFKDLRTLAREKGGWEKLKSPHEGGDGNQQEGRRQKVRVALGRAEVTADCTAEEAAAWYFEFCSRERMNIDKESGNIARLEIQNREGGSMKNLLLL